MAGQFSGFISGRLTIKEVVTDTSRHKKALCVCTCGSEKLVRLERILNNQTKSCGCILKEVTAERNRNNRIKNSNTLAYKTWLGVIQRSHLGTKGEKYKQLGISEEWLSFETFFTDMGERPFPEATIDRIENTKGYSKENCRWASQLEQQTNRTNNRRIEINQVTKCLSEWLRLYSRTEGSFYSRINAGWSEEDAICKA
jgi:hypothetical protein